MSEIRGSSGTSGSYYLSLRRQFFQNHLFPFPISILWLTFQWAGSVTWPPQHQSRVPRICELNFCTQFRGLKNLLKPIRALSFQVPDLKSGSHNLNLSFQILTPQRKLNLNRFLIILFEAATCLKARESNDIMDYELFGNCKALLHMRVYFYCENCLCCLWVTHLCIPLHRVCMCLCVYK